MKIEILGDGCSRCQVIKKKVQQAIDELGIQVEVSSVMNPEQIADLGILHLPQLVINGQVTTSDHLESVYSIKKLLSTAQKQP